MGTEMKHMIDRNKEIQKQQHLTSTKKIISLQNELKSKEVALKNNKAKIMGLVKDLRNKEEILNALKDIPRSKKVDFSKKLELLNIKGNEDKLIENQNLSKEFIDPLDMNGLKITIHELQIQARNNNEILSGMKLELEKNDEMMRVLHELIKGKEEEKVRLDRELNIKDVLLNDLNHEWKRKEEQVMDLISMLSKGLKSLHNKKID